MELSFFEVLKYFVIYSFFGWILESTYRSIGERKLVNTGFLHGPFCPIYGTGAIIMLLFLNSFSQRPVLLFFISFVILSIWEYIVGVFLEKVFKTKYWDYSSNKLNIKGRVCLLNSLMWGVLGVVFIKYIHPFIQEKVNLIDNIVWGQSAIYLLLIILIIDTIISTVKVKKLSKSLEKIENLTKEIKEKLDEIKVITEIDKDKVAQSIQNVIDDLKERRKNLIFKLYKNVVRLKKAFPDISSKEITEILNKRVEILNTEKIKQKVTAIKSRQMNLKEKTNKIKRHKKK